VPRLTPEFLADIVHLIYLLIYFVICPSALVLRPDTDPSPGATDTSRFHRMTA